MKKLTAALFSAVMMLAFAFASFADVTDELRQAADSVNISEDAENAGAEIDSLYAEGVHVFDTVLILLQLILLFILIIIIYPVFALVFAFPSYKNKRIILFKISAK